MNLFGLSPGELVLIMMIAMVVIGPEKLPETAASIGKWVREFRRVTTELTQQFTEENPFTEIQRAFSLTELTTSLNAPLPGFEPIAVPSEAVGAITEAAVASATAVVGPTPFFHRSTYFDLPAGNVPVEDSWIHSGLDPRYTRHGAERRLVISDAIVDEWAHGVPRLDPPVAVDPSPVEPTTVELATEDAGLAAVRAALAANTSEKLDAAASTEPESAGVDDDAFSITDPIPVEEARVYEPETVGAARSVGRS